MLTEGQLKLNSERPVDNFGQLFAALKDEGYVVSLERRDVTVINQWPDLSDEKRVSFFQDHLNPNGKRALRNVAEKSDLDLSDPSDYLQALGEIHQKKELAPVPPRKEISYSEPIFPAVPLMGEVLRKAGATSVVLSDPEARGIIVQTVREYLEAGLTQVRTLKEEAKTSALKRQINSVGEVLSETFGCRTNWSQLMEKGLESYFEKRGILPENRFSLFSPQGLEIAIREVYPGIASAVLAAPEVVSRRAEGIVVRSLKEEESLLSLARERHQLALEELRMETRRRLEEISLRDNRELAILYVEAGSELTKQAELARALKAINATTRLAILRVAFRELSKLPSAIWGGFIQGAAEETRIEPVAAAVSFICAGGAGASVFFFGVEPLTGAFLAGGSLLFGGISAGFLGRGERKNGTRTAVGSKSS